jgi:hypothetical protein
MKLTRSLSFGFLLTLLMTTEVMAQAFGEYGRTLGGVSQRQGGISPNAPGRARQGDKGGSAGVGDIGGRSVPSRLIVASKEAVLFPRQDAESEKITSLTQGEILVPLLQAVGGNDWYMVKTEKGLIGWVKSSDVREQPLKKP